MTPSNQIPAVCNYGTSAVYSDYPSPEQMRAGVVPLDSLPAAWWNKMWCASNCAINEARDMVGQIITEVNNVLCQAGINPQAACTDQLYQSINKIRQTLATASVPGAVVSSSVASEVAVDPATGRMTVNCLGNAASLSTSASTVVGAINELKSTYDCCFSDTATALNGKASTSHASSATTYGVGSADNYGHLKISDTYTSVLAACSGVAASQKALACVYAVACAAAAGNVSLGNTAGCALGTAAAGTAITAARSDHVHPTQGYIPYSSAVGSCRVQAFSMSTAWCGSSAEWASYLMFSHGCGSSYYNQQIRMPFGGVPQYQRMVNGTNSGWKTFITSENIASQSVKYACCASYNGSGTDFGGAATKDVFTRSTVGDIGWATAANRTKVVDVGAMAYWNGAYQDTSSNLRYYCGGAFGSAAKCDATAFRASTWTPSCVACSCKMYDATAHGCACINGNVSCSCSASVVNCYLYSCSGLCIRPTASGAVYSEGTTRISTYVFDGRKTTVCALRRQLHDMFSLASNTCYCYPSQYSCTVGEPVAGYVFTDGKRVTLTGVKFADNYNGTIYLMSCPSAYGIGALYAECGACLLCNHPGITCLSITTLFYPSW